MTSIHTIAKKEKMNVPVRVIANDAVFAQLSTDKSLEQAQNVATLPGIVDASVVMPDAHQGYGFSIGGVAAFSIKDGIISPGGIGFDINCGVRVQVLSKTYDEVKDTIPQIIDALYKAIPVGQGAEGSIVLTHEELDEVLIKGLIWAKEKGYATQDDLDRCESSGHLDAKPEFVSPTAKKRGRKQLGTLGGGNHFVELQRVDKILDPVIAEKFRITKPGQLLLMIHSGSRGLGHQTCTDYLRKFEDAFPEIADSLVERDLMYAPWSSALAQEYYGAMCACANFAWVNRFLMAYNAAQALKSFGITMQSVYDVAHNIAKVETHCVDCVEQQLIVHRKGATRAFPAKHTDIAPCYQETGHPVLIPGSMGTASYILTGTQKAMELTFGSSAHGSGRVMSRRKAFDTINPEQVVIDLQKKGIYIKAPNLQKIADEAPQAYRDSDAVVGSLEEAGVATIIVRVLPVGVIKG